MGPKLKPPLIIAFLLGGLLSCWIAGCVLPLARFDRTCKDWPQDLGVDMLVGTWEAQYQSLPVRDPLPGNLVITGSTTYLVAPGATPMPITECGKSRPIESRLQCPELLSSEYRLNGLELVVLRADGTYTQSFSSGQYRYEGEPAPWQFLPSNPEGPRLVLSRMRYFPAGVAWAGGTMPFALGPQVIDGLHAQATWEAAPVLRTLSIAVRYPADGVVYLYPRLCKGQLSLTHMTYDMGDPDNTDTVNPTFKRVGP
jgi:hypothetical protein